MTADTPAARIRRLRTALEGGLPVPADVARWMLDGLAGFEAHGGTLCGHLGLRAPGQRTLQTRHQLAIRDGWLSRAHAAIGQPGDSDWRRAQLLAERVAVLESRGVAAKPTGVDLMLAHAAEHGALPTSPKRIVALTRPRPRTRK